MLTDASPASGGDALALRAIASRMRGPLACTYSLLLLEQAAAAAQPWVLGLAIDGVLAGDVVLLWLVAGNALVYMLTGTLRRALDTRAYARLSVDLTREAVDRLSRAGAGGPAIAVRSELVDEFVDFFERYLPAAAHTGVSALGGLAALAFIDARLAVVCVAAIAPVGAVQYWYTKRSYALSGKLHDAMERRLVALEREGKRGLRGALERLRHLRVAVSDSEAACFAAIEGVSLGIVLLAVGLLAGSAGATPGSVFAGLAYVTMALGAFETAPLVLQQMAKIREIGARV